MYRYDPSYAVAVGAAHPDRFGLVAPVDPRRDDVADVIAAWAEVPGAVGVRLVLWSEGAEGVDQSGLDRVAAAAGAYRLPVCVLAWDRLDVVAALAARQPGTQFVVDHLGLRQPFEPPVPPDPFADLPSVLALARHANVALKITGAATLSQGPFPFDDLWEPLGRLLDAFGVERCMWGTDWTRATALVSYRDAVDAFRHTERLTQVERELLMGGSSAKIFSWAPAGGSVGRGE
jgi:L-fuconolactonase